MRHYVVTIFVLLVTVLMCSCSRDASNIQGVSPQLPPKVFYYIDNNVSYASDNISDTIDYGTPDEVIPITNPVDEEVETTAKESRELPSNAAFWINIPGTKVNYPVMWNNSLDSEYWLTHSPDGKDSADGSLFLDVATIGEVSGITVINGHNKANGAMFGTLVQYKNQKFADKHPLVTIEFADGTLKRYKVFATVLMNADKEAIQILFRNEKATKQYITELVRRSTISVTTDITYDNILALSTCSYEGPNYRCVVLCTLIDD